MKRTGTGVQRRAAQADSPEVAVSRRSLTGASCQGNERYPLCAAGGHIIGREEARGCCRRAQGAGETMGLVGA